MARTSWIPLALGGIGSVLLISGIQGESLSQVLKGEFGKGTTHEIPSSSSSSSRGEEGGSSTLGARAPNPLSLPNAPVAPLPAEAFSSQNKLKAIASYLSLQGIKNPTQQQVNEASYHLGYTTRKEYEEANRERRLVSGL